MNTMKKMSGSLLGMMGLGVVALPAGEVVDVPVLTEPESHAHFHTHRPDSHAPIGVMGDHTHAKGEWMLSYRYMYMSMDGHRAGTNSLRTQEVFDRGFGAAATEMDMDMHMLGLMYAPTDRLTLMAMLNYIRKDMTMEMNPHAAHHGHGDHGGHGMMGGTHSHSSEGIGDLSLGALYRFWETDSQQAHFNFSIGLPTAEVDHKEGTTFQPYGMQSGSGTWDARFGLTYLGQSEHWSWGAQVMAYLPLEDENDSGYALGDGVSATVWIAKPIHESLSVSLRANYQHQGDLEGHYNGPHDHSAPPHFQENYGGDFLELGLGMNVFFRNGWLAGHRLAVEGLMPVYHDANGVGMERDFTVTVGWQKAF
ncbi:MAG: transporter [Verrucomicrobiales bacterium]